MDTFGWSVGQGISDLEPGNQANQTLVNFTQSGVQYGHFAVYAPPPATCPWDLDSTGTVGITDFLALLAAWGTDPGGPPDFDGDGTVGIVDFLELLAHWGPCP